MYYEGILCIENIINFMHYCLPLDGSVYQRIDRLGSMCTIEKNRLL